MRLDFNVLWVEDLPRNVAAQRDGIARRMRAEGFDFNPTMCTSLSEVQKQVAIDIFNDQVDLILVDWDLGESLQGQDVIAKIRDSIRYKEVIFYSARSDTDELRKLALEAGLEGIYCATRNNLVDEVIGVFESLVKKVLDLDHTRGIVMGSTSDIDQLVIECVEAVHDRLDEDGQTAFVQEAVVKIKERIEDHAKAFENLLREPSMASLLKAHALFTANDRLRALVRALQLEHFKDLRGSRTHVTKYMNEVVPKRNVLGHKVLLPDGRTMAIAVVGGEQHIKIEKMRELRCLILDLRAEFRVLRDALLRK